MVQIHLGKEDLVLKTWRNLLGFFFSFLFYFSGGGFLCTFDLFFS